MGGPVSNEAVAAYRPLCSKLARKFTGVARAEFDDLEQEGMIAVWQLLDRGLPVSKTAIKNRLRDYCRFLRRLEAGDEAIPPAVEV